MSDKGLNLEEYLDHSRWAMNNGIVSDNVKNQLFVYGSIVHKEIQAVELSLDQEKKAVQYTLYVDKMLLEKIVKYSVLSKSTGLFGMWRFKRLLQKEGSLDFQQILNNFVKDFCGPKWNATVNVVDFNTYVESLREDSGTDDIS
jgi:hypothetical protein